MIIITGASDGLGLQLAKLYQADGKKVVNVSRNDSKYADYNLVHDLSDGVAVEAAANQIKKIDEPIEAVINCVGIYNEQKYGQIISEEATKVMATNVNAPLLLVSFLIDKIKQDEADVLNVVSTAGTKGKKDHPVYAASKWAERGLTASLKDELEETNCRVISFCPGGMRTNFFVSSVGHDQSEEDWMKPEDVAKLIKQILELPKNMEVSEIIINRKSPVRVKE